jgi:hypothetical protein
MRRGRVMIASFAYAVLAIPALLFATGSASAAPVDWGYTYNLSSWQGSAECINARNSTPGSILNQEPCQGIYTGEEWQRIQITPGSGGYFSNQTYFLLYNYHTGLCASILDNSNNAGSAVDEANCNWAGTNLYEIWWEPADPPISIDCTYQDDITWCEYINQGIYYATRNLYAIHPSAGTTTAGAGIFVNSDSNGPAESYFYYNPPLITPASNRS